MKVVITGVTGFRNRGVEALVTTTIEQLQTRLPNLETTIISHTPDYDCVRLKDFETKVSSDELQSIRKSIVKQLRARLPIISDKITPEYSSIANSNLLIVSGGDMFSSAYGSVQLKLSLRLIKIALVANIPVAFLAQSFGPFNKNDEQVFLKLLRRASLITVRESISYRYLIDILKLKKDLVKKTSDSAFLLIPSSHDKVEQMLSFYGLKKDRPVIAIAVSQGISGFSKCDRQQHLQSWTVICKRLVDELNTQLLIIPHVQEVFYSVDDRIFATDLIENLNYNPNIKLAGASHSASEFKGLLGSCDLVIAERMHAAIGGLSSGVPTVVVGYSIKAEGIMNDILGAESAHNGMLISIQDFLNHELAYNTIKTAWTRRTEVKEQLQERLPIIKKEAMDNFEFIAQLLNKDNNK
jgi:colanic acid/amylovoran biosynthesis protein